MPKMLQVIATLIAKKGEEAAVHSLLLPAVKQFRAEPGCHGYILLEDNEEPGRFVTYETWKDPSALQAHMKSQAMSELNPKLQPLLKHALKQEFLSVLIELA